MGWNHQLESCSTFSLGGGLSFAFVPFETEKKEFWIANDSIHGWEWEVWKGSAK